MKISYHFPAQGREWLRPESPGYTTCHLASV